MPASAACRAVQMTAEAVGCQLNLKMTDLLSKEQLKPSFIKVKKYSLIFKAVACQFEVVVNL